MFPYGNFGTATLDTYTPPRHAPRETASEVLHGLTIGRPDDKVSFGQMLDALGERGFGLLLMLFAVPNLLPFPGVPGVSFVTGIAILFISVLRLCVPTWQTLRWRRAASTMSRPSRMLCEHGFST